MRRLNFVLSALALVLTLGSAQAVPLSTLYGGATITASSGPQATLLFDQWRPIFQGASDPAFDPNPALIDVIALNDGGLSPGPGLAFNTGGQFSVTGDGIYAYSDYAFGFRVSSLGGLAIEDNLLTLTLGFLSWAVDGDSDLGMTIVETVRDAAGNVLARKIVEFSVLNDVETRLLTDSAAWRPGLSEVFVEKNILVWAVDQGDQAVLNGFEQRFSVPEPATLLLFGAALSSLFFARRKPA